MKICFVCLAALKTDLQGHLAVLDACLMKESLGNEYKFYFLHCGVVDYRTLRKNGIAPIQYNGNRWRSFGFLRTVLRYTSLFFAVFKVRKDENIDIFMNVWQHYFLFPVFFGARFSRCRVLARVVGIPISGGRGKGINVYRRLWRSLRLTMERLSLKKADRICTISKFLRDVLIQGGIEEEKISVISTGLDVNKFFPDMVKKKGHEIKIIYVGRLVKNKGVHIILRALRLLLDEGRNVQVWLVGDGAEKEILQKMVADLGIGEKVRFWGKVDNDRLPSLYNSCDIAVFPTIHSEGLGKAVLEAEGCGLPVIVSDVGSLPSLAADGQGFVIPPEDDIVLCETVGRLADSVELRRRMGYRGRKFVEENHSLGVVGQKYEELFSSLK